MADLRESQARDVLFDWSLNGRPSQFLPGTPDAEIARKDWRFWLVLAGRGYGKTRTGAETVRTWAEDPKARVLMIAPVASDVREVMIEGPSGIMSCYPPGRKPTYNPSRHLVTFPSGAIGFTRSADEPERLRGPQFTKFWWDEPFACRFVKEAYDQIMFGFRLPTPDLRGILTTTPKPVPVLKRIMSHPGTVITRGSSYENRANLSDDWYRDVIVPYEGTTLGRQEIYAEILDDTAGALWKRRMIEDHRVTSTAVRWDLIIRIVVAIDPAVSTSEGAAETGIVVVGLTLSGHIIVLNDVSMKGTPLEWGTAAVNAFHKYRADRMVGEVNNGGDLVEANIYSIDQHIPFRAVRATRGKVLRAEPVVSIYERGRAHHVGAFPILEDQLTTWVPGNPSPDRLDALVWGVTELAVDPEPVTTRVILDANPPPNWI